MNNPNLIPFEQGRSFASQFTARRMNDLQRSIPRIKFSGTGARVSTIGNQVFVNIPKQKSAAASVPAWPWKVYDATKGSSGAVQLNGGDGFVASLNGFVCNVNGTPNNVKTGSPAAYPTLAITGNGVVYGYAIPTTPGTPAPLSSLDLFYGGGLPSTDTANPATYFPFLVATISNYSVDGSGNVSFTVSNATNYGWTTLMYCAGSILIY